MLRILGLAILAIAATWTLAGKNVTQLNLCFRWRFAHTVAYAAIFGASLALIASGRNSPFLYFQF